jgi:hypothetical protein
MPNLREIPVGFVVEQAKEQKSAGEARPYRSLLSAWFQHNHCEPEGYEALRAIDDHFTTDTAKIQPLVLLPGCVLGRFRTNPAHANQLVTIVREIHRRMNIPMNESNKATRPEDIRQSSWTWPHVMRVMKRKGIIDDKTTKAVFGALIERILGDKVKPNSIRRTRIGDYCIVDLYDYKISTADADICNEITELFMPLLRPKN